MSFFRNGIWFVKGMKEYTKSGYEAAAKNFKAGDLNVDVSGQHFMITGANSGIGKATAIDIAKRGGNIHMVCRSKERAETAQQEIKSASGNDKVFVHLLDMSEPNSVWKFVSDYTGSGEPLDVLVNNAGCMINDRKMNADGLEMNFLTNTLGTYILTIGLLPLLQKAKRPRVITVSSGGMLVQKLNVADMQFEKLKPFDGTMAYAQNKRQQVVVTEELAKKYPDVHFSTMHPGWADTPAVQTSMPSFHARMQARLRTPEQGADTLTWLALADPVSQTKSGEFFQDRQAVPKHLPLAWTKSSQEEQAQLMTCLEELAEKYNE